MISLWVYLVRNNIRPISECPMSIKAAVEAELNK